MYLIAKLLLNSLYGKFGMHEDTFITQHAIVNDDELYGLIDDITITDTVFLNNNRNMISYIKDRDNSLGSNDIDLENLNTGMNISISLSAAITARIHMSQFKKPNNDYILLYILNK
jgi:hypothetical protein